MNHKIHNAYDWLMTIYFIPTDYQKKPAESYIEWYRRVKNEANPLSDGTCVETDVPCLLTRNTRSQIIGVIDGRDTNYPPLPLSPGDTLNSELLDNLKFSAAHLNADQQIVMKKTGNQWNNLLAEERLLLTLAVYNAGGNQGVLSTGFCKCVPN